ncbi:GH-E family nuclease [Streptomyces canus]|uniref:GH-E family nuclease n=1 Tax=Streptomyces canus TaxID=58343 RepID=UPI0036A73E40
MSTPAPQQRPAATPAPSTPQPAAPATAPAAQLPALQDAVGNQAVARAATGPIPAPEGTPADEVPLGATFSPPESVRQYLEHSGSHGAPVRVRIGQLASGVLTIAPTKGGAPGYRTVDEPEQALELTHPLLQPLRSHGVRPLIAVKVADGTVTGRVTVAGERGVPVRGIGVLLNAIRHHPAALGWPGIDGLDFPASLTNELRDGVPYLEIKDVAFTLGGFLRGKASLGLAGTSVLFEGSATLNVKGLADAELQVKRGQDGMLFAKADVPVQIVGFSGNLKAVYAAGVVDIRGKVGYRSEKMSGELTLLVTDEHTATNIAVDRLPPTSLTAGAAQGKAALDAGPKPGERAVAGHGALDVHLSEWLTGRAEVVVDNLGRITVIGSVTPPAEVLLFDQRDYVKRLFTLEVRALYGVPLVGNVFVFANVSLDALAKIGPAKLTAITVEGLFSTDDRILNQFSLRGTFGLSAYAGLRLRAEGGAGVELLGHDIKAGAGIWALAGVRGYVEAVPVIGYREKADPAAGKKGEFFMSGHMELAAQPFLSLGGDLFVELDSPWWSPAPDKTWKWPLSQLEYPLPGQFGIGADIDHVFGSPNVPRITFSPVQFDGTKFMTDLMNDKAPKRSNPAEETKKPDWKEGQAPGTAPLGVPSAGGPAQDAGKKDVPPASIDKRWLAGMQAIGELTRESVTDPFSKEAIDEALADIRARFGFRRLDAAASGDDWLIRAVMNPTGPAKVNQATADDIERKYSRPSSHRKAAIETVWKEAPRKGGKVFDPELTNVEIKWDLDPATREWYMGHKPGWEFRKHQRSAARRRIKRSTFLDEHNIASHYRPETKETSDKGAHETGDEDDKWSKFKASDWK